MLSTQEAPQKNWASFVSGSGSTMAKMGDAVLSGGIEGVHFSLVVSDNLDEPFKPRLVGLEAAFGQSIPFELVDLDSFRDDKGRINQEAFGELLNEILRDYRINIVTQNGWLPLTPDLKVDTWLNQHPNRLPHTAGLHGKQPHLVNLLYADISGERFAEPVVQRVSSGMYDQGAIVVARRVPLNDYEIELAKEDPKEAATALQKRVLDVEHQINVEALRLAGQGKLSDSPQVPLTEGKWVTLKPLRKLARQIFPEG